MKAVNATASALLALVLCLTAAIGIAAALEAPPSIMSRGDYLAGLRIVQDDGRVAMGRCRGIAHDYARALCRAEARAAHCVAAATLLARYRGTIAAHARVDEVRLRAGRSVDFARRLAPA